MRPNGKGGNYWQLNQSNQHSSTYSSIKQQKKNPYYGTIHNEYAREKPRINRQNRQKITFPGSAYPKEISQQCTPATHTEAMHCQGGPLGGSSIPIFDHWMLVDPPWGEGCQTSHQPTDASTPTYTVKIRDWIDKEKLCNASMLLTVQMELQACHKHMHIAHTQTHQFNSHFSMQTWVIHLPPWLFLGMYLWILLVQAKTSYLQGQYNSKTQNCSQH